MFRRGNSSDSIKIRIDFFIESDEKKKKNKNRNFSNSLVNLKYIFECLDEIERLHQVMEELQQLTFCIL